MKKIWQRCWIRLLKNTVLRPWMRPDTQRRKAPRPRVELLEDRLAPANFTAGNIAVLDLAAASNNTTGSILELSPSTANQSPVQTIPIFPPTNPNAPNPTTPIRFSDSGTSGFLARTNDGTLLTFAAYNTTDTTDSDLANSPTSDRAVATLDNGGAFTLQTTYTGISGNQARSATSLDDSNFFITDKGGLYTNGATGASLTTNILDTRAFGGIVYVSSTKAATGVSTVSSPTATTLSALPGLPADGTIQDFYLIQSGSNGSTYDVLYTLDQNATKTGAATLNKYSLVSGNWVANGSFSLAGNATAMIAAKSGNGAFLYVVTTAQAADNSVVRLTDANGYNATISISTANNVTLFTATGTSTLKGLDFAPVPAVVPTVTSPTKTGIGISTATLGGTLTITGGEAITQRGIVYSTSSSNLTIGQPGVTPVPATGTSLGAFTVNVSGLQGTTTYFYAAYATSSAGTGYSSVDTFSTQSANPPTVDTPSDTSITDTSAVLGGTVESDGGATITSSGVVYALASADSNPHIGDGKAKEVDTASPVDSGAFTISATNLTPGATYTFEAFATNSSGTTYTAATNFTTLAAPTVNKPTFTNVTSTSAILGGNVASDGGSTITKHGIVYAPTGQDSNPTLNDGTALELDATGTTGTFTVPVPGLSAATGYTFKAFAINGIGTTYTTATSFTTAAANVITAWTFPTTAGAPDNSPVPTYGTGAATTLGMSGFANANGPNTSASDDVLSTSGSGNPNFTENLWRIRGAPNNGWSQSAPQYSQGIELDTSTVGYSNIVFAFDWYSTTQGVRDLQVQYNTGSGWVPYKGTSPTGTFIATSNDYNNAGLSPVNPTIYIDLSNVPGASNNPDLGIRLVSAYDSTGTLTGSSTPYASATSTPGNVVPYNNTSGNWRFGNLIFYGNSTTTTTTLAASPAGSQDFGQNVTLTATVTPAGGSQFSPGTVNFYDGNNLIGSQSVSQVGTSNVGTAVLNTSTLNPGVHGDITAQYVPTTTSLFIASGSSMNLSVGSNPISFVINAPQATGVDVSPVVGQSFTGVVAAFSDGLDVNPGDFTATINWGDNSPSTSGIIAFAGTTSATNISGQVVNVSLLTVTGTHTYATAGSYSISVTITDAGNNKATVSPNARVAYPALLVSPKPVNAVAGVALSNVPVATFTDPGLVANLAALGISDPTTQFSATINWDDGSQATTGTISSNSTTQVFSVLGSHTYAHTGAYSIGVTVTPLTVSVERTDSSDPNALNEVGDENGNGLTDSASPDFIDQFVIGAANQAGALSTVSLPTVANFSGTGNEALTNSAYSRSEAELTLSANGQYLVLGGYNTTVDLYGPQSTFSDAPVYNRVIGTVDGAGNVITTTDLANAYSGDNFRGVVSTDGTQFWTAGHSGTGTDGNVRYVNGLGTTTSAAVTAGDPSNINTVEIFNGQLYEGVRKVASDAPAGIYQIGTGLPTTAGQSQALFIQVPQSNPLDVFDGNNPTGPVGFWMTALNNGNPTINGVNVAYIADAEMGIARYDDTTSGWQFSYYIDSTGAIKDSAFSVGSDGSVTANGSFSTSNPPPVDASKAGGVRELTGRVVNGQVQLFAVTGFGNTSEPIPGNSLIEVTDTGASAGYTVLATDTTGLSQSPGKSVFTGVAFTPYQAVTSSAEVDAITQGPSGRNINVGQGTTFTAATANPTGNDTVQWQVSTDGGHTFSPLSDGGAYSGTATTTLTITAAPASLNGNQYEAVFSTAAGTLTTSAATLTVDSVSANPSNSNINAHGTATFTAASVNPTGTDTVQWQVSSDGGHTFSPLSDGGAYSGTATTMLTITNATTSLSGNEYEAVFTNAAGTLTTSAATLTVSPLSTTTAVTSSSPTSSFGQSVTFTATVSAAAGTPGGMVTFLDDGVFLGTASLGGGQAVFSTGLLSVGTHTITAVYGGDANDLGSKGTTTQSVEAAIYVLNKTASGALSLSGNAKIDAASLLSVSSSSSAAVKLSGNADVTAAAVRIAGGDQVSGHASFEEAPVSGAATGGDPLAGEAVPTAGASQGPITVSSGTVTLGPGTYSSITVSGNGHLILKGGTYVIGTGGITVSGNATVSDDGTGILLYNNGGLTISGNASVNLTAAATGPDAGIAIFQALADASAVSVSGNANLNLHGGALYAANQQSVVTFSGNAKVDASLVVNDLVMSGNAEEDAL
jgi:hypothetical protein